MDTKQTAQEQNKIVSITEAAKMHNVTRQAIYVAIKLQKLKAIKDTNHCWMINLDDLNEYRNSRYSRTKSVFEGELLFDNHKGYFSVNQVAKMLNVPAQKIYYATRSGYLKASRRGSAWVIHEEDVKSYKTNLLHTRKKRAA